MTREQAHDEFIQPLMDQILKLCKEHQIPVLATFHLDEEMLCTSCLMRSDWAGVDSVSARRMKLAYRILLQKDDEIDPSRTVVRDEKGYVKEARIV